MQKVLMGDINFHEGRKVKGKKKDNAENKRQSEGRKIKCMRGEKL